MNNGALMLFRVAVFAAFASTCASFAPCHRVYPLLQGHHGKLRSALSLSPARKKDKKKRSARNKDKKNKKGKNRRAARPSLTRNERRLRSRACDCAGCRATGCAVDEAVGDVEVVRSATQFFSSAAIAEHRVGGAEEGFHVVVPTETRGWRTQAKLAAAPRPGGGDGCAFGLYARGTHEVIEMSACRVHHPAINRAIRALTEATRRAGTRAGAGGLRYVQLRVERATGTVSLALVWGASELRRTQPALSRLTEALSDLAPDLWHGAWCHCNDGAGNNIFSRDADAWHRLSGREFVREPLPASAPGSLHFSPLVFRQGNADGFDAIAKAVARRVPGGSRVCELYAGVGVLGLTCLAWRHGPPRDDGSLGRTTGGGGGAAPLEWVRCSDENPANARCFSETLRSL